MASACALSMFSGKNLFIFVVQKRLRAFLNHFFTRGVAAENGSCRKKAAIFEADLQPALFCVRFTAPLRRLRSA